MIPLSDALAVVVADMIESPTGKTAEMRLTEIGLAAGEDFLTRVNWYLGSRTSWFPPNVVPARKGLYERDWRGTDILPVEERAITLDLWEPVENQMSILYPGVWYAGPPWNDASIQQLPWRGLLRDANTELTGRASAACEGPR